MNVSTHDIEVKLTFDYKNDTGFVMPNYPYTPNGVMAIDFGQVQEKDLFKEIGWFTVWGKELDDIDMTQQGGMAFVGNDESWLFFRKHIAVQDATSISGSGTIESIIAHASLRNRGRKNPVIVALVIDGMQICMLIQKNDSQTEKMLGNRVKESSMKLAGASIPFPAIADWVKHPQYQKNKRVSNLSLAHHKANITIEVTVSKELSISWRAASNPMGGSFIMPPKDVVLNSDPVTSEPDLLATLGAMYPNSAIAQLVAWGEDEGYIHFDPPSNIGARAYSRKYKTGWSDAKTDGSDINTTTTVKASNSFVAPEELQLPKLPSGTTWKFNVRGVIIMEKQGNLLWPHEVYNLREMTEDLASLRRNLLVESNEKSKVELQNHISEGEAQVELVKKLFEYQKEIGDTLSLQARIFLETT